MKLLDTVALLENMPMLNLYRRKVVAGHQAQIFYDGIPVGEPTEKIVYQAKTVDREAVSAALELARQGLQKGLMKDLNSATFKP